MKIWSRLKKLSIKQLLNLGVVFIQRPLLIRPTLKATSKTMSISQKEFGSAQHKNGKPNGNLVYWYENGSIKREGRLKNGSPIGRWTYYNLDGSIEKTTDH